MNAISHFAAQTWARILAWTKALNQTLTTPAPLETDGFGRRDDGSIFQPRDLS